ncbi:MAG: hypothetical protein AB8B73_02030 [Ekhidna sp.]
MNRNFLQLEQSGWWVPVIILVAFGFAYFLYSKKGVPWGTVQNRFLGFIRFFSVFMLLLLFLEPSLKSVSNETEKPIVAIAIDNSQSSVANITDSTWLKAQIRKLKNELEEMDFVAEIYSMDDKDSIYFSNPTTNLSGLLQRVDQRVNGKNFAATILLSDGIYNRGSSLAYRSYLAPVFSVGLGDTIPPRDVKISRVLFNKITFKGNETPVEVEINQKGYDNKQIKVILSEGGKVLEEKEIRFSKAVQEVTFLVNNEEESLRHLEVSIPLFDDEAIQQNNHADLFMEVIDGREKVLIVAAAPHPDIKAIRATLEATDNYQTELYIPNLSDQKPNEIFDVIIYHGAFSSSLNYQPKENPGVWYILNSESSLVSANKVLPYLNIKRNGSQPDKVTAAFNSNFTKFKMEDVSAFEEFPPLEVPFGDYSTSGPTEILMYQRLGSITTKKPLMAFYDNGIQKSAVLMGQNIWRWKLQESAVNETSEQFQSFVTKTVQFLSVKNDKKRFQFKTRNTSFSSSQPIIFDSEVYNDIYERVYGSTINLTITSEEGEEQKFDFVDSEINSTFKVPALARGIYSYSAKTSLGEKYFSERGEFIVEDVNPEYVDLTANHNLLRITSQKSGGQFIHFSEMQELPEIINDQDFKSLIRSTNSFSPLQESLLWFLIIFLLFSTEWILRKYWGGY